MFGRKGLAPRPRQPWAEVPATPPPISHMAEHDAAGHRHVLDLLRREEAEKPLQRASVAGGILFRYATDLATQDGRVRAEDLIALLAALGGFSCIEAALAQLSAERRTPEAAGMAYVSGKDGSNYWFGDLPNRYLWESDHSLLSIVLGNAHALGAPVTAELVGAAMKRTASLIGTPAFGEVDLDPAHRPTVAPFELVRLLRHKVTHAVFHLYQVPHAQRPAAFGVATSQAIAACKDVLDPLLAARLAIACAVPMAKLDPARFT